MRATNLELHGIDAPLEDEILLTAGRFEAIFEPTRAYLRRVRIDGVEVVRLVYLHARAEDWSTVVPAVSDLKVKVGTDHFALTWIGRHRAGEINFEWLGSLTGSPNAITYRCEGQALSDFKTRRTGMCALLPNDSQGRPARVTHPDGSSTTVVLPQAVSPTEPLHGMGCVEIEAIRLTFQGAIFNVEDQRNWTDASYKCYSVWPAGKPNDRLAKGDAVSHTLIIEPTGVAPSKLAPGVIASGSRPLIGAEVSDDQADLAELTVDFLRVKLGDVSDRSRAVLEHARSRHLPLIVSAPEGASPVLRAGETLIAQGARDRPSTTNKVWLGADSFVEVNMSDGDARKFDGLEVAGTPQVHTFDERSIIENASALSDIVRSMNGFGPTASSSYFHANLGLNMRMRDGALDPRMRSLFGALWVLQSFAAVYRYGFCHLTIGSVDDVRHTPIAELIAELTRTERLQMAGVTDPAEMVVMYGEPTILGNLLRRPKRVHIDGRIGHVASLSPRGWVGRRFRSGDVMQPYEILRLDISAPRVITE